MLPQSHLEFSPAFTRLSLLRAVQLLFLCLVLGLQEEENVEKSGVQVFLRLWASPLVGCMGWGQHLMCKPSTWFFRCLLVL